MNGTFLLALGAIWREVALSEPPERVAYHPLPEVGRKVRRNYLCKPQS